MQKKVIIRVIFYLCSRFLITKFLIIDYNNHCSFKWEIVCLHSQAKAVLAPANPKASVYLGSITSRFYGQKPELESGENRA